MYEVGKLGDINYKIKNLAPKGGKVLCDLIFLSKAIRKWKCSCGANQGVLCCRSTSSARSKKSCVHSSPKLCYGEFSTLTIIKSNRARRMRIAIYCDGRVLVTVPSLLGESLIKKFIFEKKEWISEHLNKFLKSPIRHVKLNTKGEYKKSKIQAFNLVKERLDYFNRYYNFPFNKVSIKNQKTRWGSCSKRGNLNFNYKILFLPMEARDYIIVHELCHLKEFNHSKNFWNLVKETIPNFQDIRKSLRS
jgi:predicted metal-dependent hydrolase